MSWLNVTDNFEDGHIVCMLFDLIADMTPARRLELLQQLITASPAADPPNFCPDDMQF
jgi:hypothetical protein